MRALILTPEHPHSAVLKEIDRRLSTYQQIVGGTIEHVSLVPGVLGLYVNDEGAISDPPLAINKIATVWYWATHGIPLDNIDAAPIHGPAIMLGGPDVEGHDLDVPQQAIDLIANSGITIIQEVEP